MAVECVYRRFVVHFHGAARALAEAGFGQIVCPFWLAASPKRLKGATKGPGSVVQYERD
jgi:hypothetical protein